MSAGGHAPATPSTERPTDARLRELLDEPAAGLAPGARIGRYVIRRVLGQGGMGTVYAAHDPQLGRDVAVKMVRAGAAGVTPDSRATARLLREAQALARLAHPNVVAVHDAGTSGESVFLAMELVEGQTLRAWAASADPPRARRLAVLLAAGRGLEAAHRQGLVHRDFKPDNVIVGTDGRARVLDFGVAHDARADGEPAAARVGTPAYMPPEQRAGRPADARSDQYSYCVTCHEILFGHRPGDDAGASDLDDEPLRDALAVGLAPDPEDRYADMGQVLHAMEAAAQVPPVSPVHRSRGWLIAGATLALAPAIVWLGLDPGDIPAVAAADCHAAPGQALNPLEVGRAWIYQVSDPRTGLPVDGGRKTVEVEAMEDVGGCRAGTRAFRVRRTTRDGHAYRWQEVVDAVDDDGQAVGRRTLRHRDQWFGPDGQPTRDRYYAPTRLRLDETCDHLAIGATYPDLYEVLDVPAGGSCDAPAAREHHVQEWTVEGPETVELLLDYRDAACCPGGAAPCRPPPDGPGHTCARHTEPGQPGWHCTFETLRLRRRDEGGAIDATYWFAPGVGKVRELTVGREDERLVCFAPGG